MWTVVIVFQVALSVAFLPLAVAGAASAFESREDPGFDAASVVTAQLGRDPVAGSTGTDGEAAFLDTSKTLFEQVGERLEADPAVERVAFASGLSAMNHLLHTFEFVGDASEPAATVRARVLLVDADYLELMGATPVSGRALEPADHTPEARAVVVNQAFADQILGGRNPVGAQLRVPEGTEGSEGGRLILSRVETGMDIVGLVDDPGIDRYGPGAHPTVYAPLALAPVSPRSAGLVGMPDAPAVQLFIRIRPGSDPLAGRLFAEVSAVDPSLRLSEVGTAAQAWRSAHIGARLGGWVFVAVATIVLMLSVAGIFALMSFAVTRRSREIAIRSALGARREEIVGLVFRRAFLQLLAGVALGSVVAVPALWDGGADDGPRTLVVVSMVLIGAGLVSCLVPVRRALAIEPASAMKSD